jgi:hypothetical protein
MKRSFEQNEENDHIQNKLARTVSQPITFDDFKNNQDTNMLSSSSSGSDEISSCQDSHESSSQASQDSHESSSQASQDSQDSSSQHVFEPTDIEKQVIRHSLAMICRSNASDWNYLISEDEDNMVLKEKCILLNEKRKTINYDIILEVNCMENVTCCRILYNLEKDPFSLEKNPKFYELFYNWNNINNCITFTKEEEIITNYFFSLRSVVNKITKTRCIVPENSRVDSWCYFQDARSHLNSLRIF